MAQTYTCTCPDFSRTQEHLIGDGQGRTVRDWRGSGAGALGVGKGWCKHIWATALLRGEVTEDDIPTDIPIPLFEEVAPTQDKELYGRPYRGHRFKPDGGFGIQTFKPYRGG